MKNFHNFHEWIIGRSGQEIKSVGKENRYKHSKPLFTLKKKGFSLLETPKHSKFNLIIRALERPNPSINASQKKN
ncbi:MAG: hypothetical protein B7Y25_04465 [Alphaproteobacteria bacterium 16-39-46]|nr:MAG: hypothetical protein B7Y25_04465 [Alphaproteobacteria bacterium 16-39-46]OZA42985.1 MAG: hypothetical protein B7X84_04385 [Alphaproteobacteria bacterium 17-39-52]